MVVSNTYCAVFYVLFVFVLCLVYGGVQHILCCVFLCMVVSNAYSVVFLFCFSSFYVRYVYDRVLRQFSELALSGMRDGDYFGRLGGEEFLLVLPKVMPTAPCWWLNVCVSVGVNSVSMPRAARPLSACLWCGGLSGWRKCR